MTEPQVREHFIPLRKADVVDLLCREPELTEAERDDFRRLCRMLEATFHFEFHGQLEDLKDTYAPFDPDADTRALVTLSHEERQKRLDELFAKFVWLLERANFRRLSEKELNEALTASSDWGLNLHVDFSVFEKLEVFARGDAVLARKRRRMRKLYRQEDVQVPIFRRLVVILRLRPHKRLGRLVDSRVVYIKVFKDIPKMDLEMLLPGTEVRMTLTDRGKITAPLLTGMGITGWKLLPLMALLQAGGLAALGAGHTLLAYLGLASGTVGYGVRSFFGYQAAKNKHQLTLTQSLYFQNLDNNAGVLFRLLDEAEEQECREAMLAYFFLWRHAGDQGWTEEELDRHVEQFLERAANVKVDFEVNDALDKLKRLRIVEQSSEGRLRAVPIAKALEALDHAWDNYFRYNQP